MKTGLYRLAATFCYLQLWYLMTIALLGRTTKGAGWYQDYLPSLPVPPLDHTCKM